MTTRRQPRLPRPVEPSAIWREYTRWLQRGPVGALRVLAKEELAPLLTARTDASRSDEEPDPDKVEASLRRMVRRYFATFPEQKLANEVRRLGKRISEHQREQLRRQFTAAVGTDPFLLEPWLPERIEAFVAENVGLIRTVPERFFGEVQETIVGGVRAGRRPESLQKDLEERLGVSEWNARRIARDQVSKFNAELARERQEELGVDEYVWRTMADNRVRDDPEGQDHVSLNGTRQRWNDPPEINARTGERGHPGDAVLCRCYAEPVLTAFLGTRPEQLEAPPGI